MDRDHNKIKMIIFLFGPDAYRLKENLDIVVSSYRKKHENGMSYYRFDMEGGNNFDELANAVKSVSFFDEAKLIVVKNFFSSGSIFFDKLAALASDLNMAGDPPSHKASDGQGKKTVLVFVENGTQSELQKADKGLFSFLNKKPNLVRSIDYLDGTKLSNWVRNKFKENGHDVSPAVANLLIGIVGNESWALANEINKLSNHKKDGLITEKDIDLLVSRKEDGKIFDLIDAVGNQNKTKAFEMMYRLTHSGHESHYLLSMLVYHFENLLSVCEGSVPKHIHPFVAKKAASQARKFSKEELLSKFNRLAELDVISKNGQANLEDAIYNFVVS